eukprot:scaffold3849_cov179-Amphora_coffeaeformis.AAC.28
MRICASIESSSCNFIWYLQTTRPLAWPCLLMVAHEAELSLCVDNAHPRMSITIRRLTMAKQPSLRRHWGTLLAVRHRVDKRSIVFDHKWRHSRHAWRLGQCERQTRIDGVRRSTTCDRDAGLLPSIAINRVRVVEDPKKGGFDTIPDESLSIEDFVERVPCDQTSRRVLLPTTRIHRICSMLLERIVQARARLPKWPESCDLWIVEYNTTDQTTFERLANFWHPLQ